MQTVTIPLVRNVFADRPETIQLALQSPKGADLGTPAAATVNVSESLAPPMQDVTGLVQVVLGKVKRVHGRRFMQMVKLVNMSGEALTGPLTLVLGGLHKPVRLFSQMGLTHAAGKPGSPYLVLVPGPGPFAAGASRTFMLFFRSPSAKKIVYQPTVLAGVGTP
jgi:hypothetical protein